MTKRKDRILFEFQISCFSPFSINNHLDWVIEAQPCMYQCRDGS